MNFVRWDHIFYPPTRVGHFSLVSLAPSPTPGGWRSGFTEAPEFDVGLGSPLLSELYTEPWPAELSRWRHRLHWQRYTPAVRETSRAHWLSRVTERTVRWITVYSQHQRHEGALSIRFSPPSSRHHPSSDDCPEETGDYTTVVHSDMHAYGQFLANVKFRPSVRLSFVCLSVTLVHPTQAAEIFGNISTYLVPWPSVDVHEKLYGDRAREPLRRGC